MDAPISTSSAFQGSTIRAISESGCFGSGTCIHVQSKDYLASIPCVDHHGTHRAILLPLDGLQENECLHHSPIVRQ